MLPLPPLLIGGRLAVPGGDTMYLAAVAVAATILLIRMHWLLPYVIATASISFAVGLDLVAARVAELGPTSSVAESIGSISLAWLMLVVIPAALAFGRVGEPKIHTALPVVATSFGSPLTYAALYGAFTADLDRFDWALVAAAAALLHAGLGLALRNQGRSVVARIQLIPAGILTLLSLFAGLSGDWLLVGMIAISAAAVVGGGRSGIPNLKDFGHVGAAITLIATAITSGLAAFEPRTITQLIPGAVVLGFIAATGLYLRDDETEGDEMDKVYLTTAFVGTAGWMFVEFPRLGSSGLAAVTAGLATLGLGAIVVGKVTASRITLGLGFSTVGVAMAKLFGVDLAEATPLVRIALFAGIGVALLGSGYWLGDAPAGGDTDSSATNGVTDRRDAGNPDDAETDPDTTGAEFPITDVLR